MAVDVDVQSPVRTLRWLAGRLAEVGLRLHPGQVILTGRRFRSFPSAPVAASSSRRRRLRPVLLRFVPSSTEQRRQIMAYDGTLVLEYLTRTHKSGLLTDREKQFAGVSRWSDLVTSLFATS
jgi:hypothetical protein